MSEFISLLGDIWSYVSSFVQGALEFLGVFFVEFPTYAFMFFLKLPNPFNVMFTACLGLALVMIVYKILK